MNVFWMAILLGVRAQAPIEPAAATPAEGPLAGSASVPVPDQDRVRNTVSDVLVFNERQRANEACFYQQDERTWSCDPHTLARFQLHVLVEVEGPAGFMLSGSLPGTEPQFATCYATGVQLSLRNPAADVVIDWDRVSFVVNGHAFPAVPGFARRVTSGLSQRTVRVPQDTAYEETVFPVNEADCVLPAPEGRASSTILDVPLHHAERIESLRVIVTQEFIAVSEAQAFAHVAAPLAAHAPVLEEPSVPIPFGGSTTCGLGACLLGAGSMAGLWTYASINSNSLVPLPVWIVTLPCCGLLPGAVGGVAGYLAFDSPGDDRYDEDIRYWTWVKKRRELGLERQPVQAH